MRLIVDLEEDIGPAVRTEPGGVNGSSSIDLDADGVEGIPEALDILRIKLISYLKGAGVL